MQKVESTARADVEAPARRVRRIVDESYDFVWRSLRRLGVPPAFVDDGAQQVFVVLVRRLDDVETGAERAFLFGVAVRVAADLRRSARRRREDPAEGVLDSLAHDGPSPEEIAEARSSRKILDRALDAMPIEQRTVFILYELEELSMAEVAKMIRIPPGTAASRLRRARELFDEAIKSARAEEVAFEERRGAS